MARELQTSYLTGFTVYFLLRNSTAQIWNGVAFEDYATGNYGNYPITGTEQGTASAYYTGDMPATSAGVYSIIAKLRAGGSPAETDMTIGTQEAFQWNGSISLPLSNIAASGIPVDLLSGRNVMIYSGQLSGQPVNPLSGVTVPLSGLTFIASGPFVNAPIASLSGLQPASGLFVTVPIASISGVQAASGLFTNASLNSGQQTIPYSGSLSGQKVELFSGNVMVPLSGASVVASLYSGQSVLVYSGQLSGQPVNPLSGFVYPASGMTFIASGPFVNVPASTISGVQANSGLFVNASLNSGQQTIPYSGSLSGQKVELFSGNVMVPLSGASVIAALYSGQVTGVYSGNLSGQQISLQSGVTQLASGQSVNLNSGIATSIIPNSILGYDFSGVTGAAQRSLLNANRKLINKWDLTTNSGYLTVFKEDDSSEAYTQAVTSQSGAPPITSLDTN